MTPALTPLQQRVCRIVTEVPKAEQVPLAGDGALITHGMVDRATTDLDGFAPDVFDVCARTELIESPELHECWN